MQKSFTKTQKLTFSAMYIDMYIVIMALTQSFAFGQYQIRIATTLYALAYFNPFLIIPAGLANLMSNLFFGGLGIIDMLEEPWSVSSRLCSFTLSANTTCRSGA